MSATVTDEGDDKFRNSSYLVIMPFEKADGSRSERYAIRGAPGTGSGKSGRSFRLISRDEFNRYKDDMNEHRGDVISYTKRGTWHDATQARYTYGRDKLRGAEAEARLLRKKTGEPYFYEDAQGNVVEKYKPWKVFSTKDVNFIAARHNLTRGEAQRIVQDMDKLAIRETIDLGRASRPVSSRPSSSRSQPPQRVLSARYGRAPEFRPYSSRPSSSSSSSSSMRGEDLFGPRGFE